MDALSEYHNILEKASEIDLSFKIKISGVYISEEKYFLVSGRDFHDEIVEIMDKEAGTTVSAPDKAKGGDPATDTGIEYEYDQVGVEGAQRLWDMVVDLSDEMVDNSDDGTNKHLKAEYSDSDNEGRYFFEAFKTMNTKQEITVKDAGKGTTLFVNSFVFSMELVDPDAVQKVDDLLAYVKGAKTINPGKFKSFVAMYNKASRPDRGYRHFAADLSVNTLPITTGDIDDKERYWPHNRSLGVYVCPTKKPPTDYIKSLCQEIVFNLPENKDNAPDEALQLKPVAIISVAKSLRFTKFLLEETDAPFIWEQTLDTFAADKPFGVDVSDPATKGVAMRMLRHDRYPVMFYDGRVVFADAEKHQSAPGEEFSADRHKKLVEGFVQACVFGGGLLFAALAFCVGEFCADPVRWHQQVFRLQGNGR